MLRVRVLNVLPALLLLVLVTCHDPLGVEACTYLHNKLFRAADTYSNRVVDIECKRIAGFG
jgi:hypothetical protein